MIKTKTYTVEVSEGQNLGKHWVTIAQDDGPIIWMTEDQALAVAYKFMALGKGQFSNRKFTIKQDGAIND